MNLIYSISNRTFRSGLHVNILHRIFSIFHLLEFCDKLAHAHTGCVRLHLEDEHIQKIGNFDEFSRHFDIKDTKCLKESVETLHRIATTGKNYTGSQVHKILSVTTDYVLIGSTVSVQVLIIL